MIRGFLLAATVALLTGCGAAPEAQGQGKGPDKSGPTQIEAVTFGLKSDNAGERLFGQKCAFCHVGKNTGTTMLKKRLDKSQPAELHKRMDLEPDYVRTVVRNGLVNMPALNRAELSDADLDAIANWLGADKTP